MNSRHPGRDGGRGVWPAAHTLREEDDGRGSQGTRVFEYRRSVAPVALPRGVLPFGARLA